MTTIWPLEVARRKHRHSERIAAALVDLLPRMEPVLDLGCGPGHYLNVLSQAGFRCLGVEGTPGIEKIAVFPRIVEADLAQPLQLDWPKSSVLCLEVGEHLRPDDETQLIDNIDANCSGRLVLSWAIPGQLGTGHRNCRPNSHVVRQLKRRGFDLDAEATFSLRELAEDRVKYFRNTLLVFRCAARSASAPRPGHPTAAAPEAAERFVKDAHKIFGIGYGRTGTRSLAAAMKQIGYSVKHGVKALDDVEAVDFSNDIAVTWRYKFLDYVYPNAKFILTVRDVDDWLQSCEEHAKKARGGPIRRLENRFWLYGICHFDRTVLRDAFLRHQDEVMEHFTGRPEKVLKMDICGGDGWETLCPFLEVDLPKSRFPFRSDASPDNAPSQARS